MLQEVRDNRARKRRKTNKKRAERASEVPHEESLDEWRFCPNINSKN